MVSLGALVQSAGAALRPLIPFDASRPIAGVHASELAEPGRYLEGGELLLTTGIPMRGKRADELYLDRLVSHGLGAIGIGLGEGWDAVPASIQQRCRDLGLPLFVVPDGVPFLAVSRAYWDLAEREKHSAALNSVHTHTQLAEAAVGTDPLPSMVRLLAQAIGGWAAWIPFDQHAPDAAFHPPTLAAMLGSITEDVDRSLVRSGVSAASFVAHGSNVVALAVAQDQSTAGALTLGAGRPLAKPDRQLARTAVALVHLLLRRSAAPETGPGHWVCELALQGDVASARAVARATGVALPEVVRIVIDPDATYRDAALSTRRGEGTVHLIDAHGEVTLARGLLSPPVTLDQVPAQLGRCLTEWEASAQTALVLADVPRAERWAEELGAGNPDVLATVRAYLRHHHLVDRTARELGVHRNTIRPRIDTAESALGISLNDPDVSAELWIALREREQRSVVRSTTQR